MEELNLTGLCAAANTLVFIGIGFFWVIKLDYFFGACVKRIILFVGLALLLTSFFIPHFTYAAIVGLLAGTIIWGSTEMEDQEERSESGVFPDNPNKYCNKKKSQGILFTSKKLKKNGTK